MSVPLSLVIGALGLAFTALAYMAGQKKTNKDDGQKMGEFIGEFRAEQKRNREDIKEIKNDIREIKNDRLGIEDAIQRAIAEHERMFHCQG